MEKVYARIKKDFKSNGIFYGLFLTQKIKYWLTIDKFGIIEEHKTFTRFPDSKRLLHGKEYFKMMNREKVKADLHLSWRKSFTMGVVIPSTNRYYTDCDKNFLCDKCNKLVNQTKNFDANLNESKRKLPNSKGYKLAWYKNKLSEQYLF